MTVFHRWVANLHGKCSCKIMQFEVIRFFDITDMFYRKIFNLYDALYTFVYSGHF